jgi:hypothetical protein
LIYVVEDLGQYPDCDGGSRAFSTSVGPSSYEGGLGWRMGWRQPREFVLFLRDHFWRASSLRDWQSRLATRSRAFAMANFTAEEGKVYYFRERVFPGEGDDSFDLDPINSDEGKYLVAYSAFSVSHPKK